MAIFGAGFLILIFSYALLPERARAFLLFSSDANAAQNTVTPASHTPLLRAATNVDPNPDKGLGASLQTSSGSALLAYAGPSGTIANTPSAHSSGRISVYVVRKGDTLSEIASMFNVSVNTIIWANNLDGPRDVRPGDTLVILPISGIERVIEKGDTLKSLAKKYSADADEIADFNGLDPKDPLEIGSSIIIPRGEIATSPAPSNQKKSSGSIQSPYLGGGGIAQTGYYVNPIPGGLITQGVHGWNGIDIGAARGTPVRSAADGVVIVARGGGNWNGGYGNYVVITHDNGTQTLYSHLSSVTATPGQFVSAGQVIGYVGRTGVATGFHLHFEVRGAKNPFAHCFANTVCSPQ